MQHWGAAAVAPATRAACAPAAACWETCHTCLALPQVLAFVQEEGLHAVRGNHDDAGERTFHRWKMPAQPGERLAAHACARCWLPTRCQPPLPPTAMLLTNIEHHVAYFLLSFAFL